MIEDIFTTICSDAFFVNDDMNHKNASIVFITKWFKRKEVTKKFAIKKAVVTVSTAIKSINSVCLLSSVPLGRLME